MNNTKICYASNQDVDDISGLLASEELPTHDIKEYMSNFFVAKDGERLVGTIGLERYGSSGLLRSLCVHEAYRHKGVGSELVNHIISLAQLNHISELYLLTLTAENFFKNKGFNVVLRESAPELVKASKEFSTICPDDASCLYLRLDG